MKPTDTIPRETRRRPWLRTRSRPLRQSVILDRQPLIQISIFADAVYLTRRQGTGWITYPISPTDLVLTVGKLPQHAGLLPPNTLGTGTVNGARFYVLLVPPRRVALQFAGAKRPAVIQTPPLIWAGCGQDYRIFALNTLEPPTLAMPLCFAPFPNTYETGAICWGTSDQRQDAAPDTLLPTLDLYLEGSCFNRHLVQQRSRRKPHNVTAVYRTLNATTAYPLDDLVSAGRTLEWLVTGAPWRTGGLR